MQPRTNERTIGRRIALALTLCGLLAYGGSAFARGAAGDGGGGNGAGSNGGGASADGSTGSAVGSAGQSGGTGLNGLDSALAPIPIKLQKLLERHHLTRSRILDAEIDRKNGRWIYELKLLDADGVVRELRYNALNGDALPQVHD